MMNGLTMVGGESVQYGSLRYRRVGLARVVLLGFASIAGTIMNAMAYESIEPLIVAACFFAFGFGLLLVSRIGGAHERKQFTAVFLTLWAISGVAAIYARVFGDYEQLYSDAANFYYYSSTGFASMSMEDLLELTEGAGAVVLWSRMYDLFAAFGIERQPYVGICFNVFQIGLTAVFAVKICKICLGEESSRLDRLGLMIVACGTFWIFGALHLRDAAILLLVTALVYAWVAMLSCISVARLILLLTLSVLASFAFMTLRLEFVFVPAVFLFAAVFVMWVSGSRQIKTHWFILLLAVGIAAIIALGISNYEALAEAMETGNIAYGDEAILVSSHDSLGAKFIVDAILPVRLVLGSIYLFVFPIPVWVGFQLESAYNLFKSANAIYFYFVIPLLVLAAYELYRSRAMRTPQVMFLGVVVVGFALGIAATSLETRHMGAFLVPLLVLAAIPDLSVSATRQMYRYLVGLLFFGMASVHAIWAIMKYGI